MLIWINFPSPAHTTYKCRCEIKNAAIQQVEDFIKIYNNSEVFYINKSGEVVTNKEVYPNNKLYAKQENGKWGFVDSKGNNVIDYKYENVTEQNGNYVGVKLNGKWGVLDIKGNEVVEPKYELSQNNPSFLNKYYQH